jgi:pectinesterase inhibitor-like protein
MACTSKLFLLLVAMFLGFIAFVSGDATLINNVCGKSGNPVYCHKCFNMYSRSSNEDVKALGRTSLDCSSLQSINVMGLIDKLVVNTTDRALKNAYIDCELKLSSGDQQINSALKSWQNARYVDAGNQMLAAQQAVGYCIARLQKIKLSLTPVNELRTLHGFCGAAIGVLKQIH